MSLAFENLTCFKAYDVRGELGVNLDALVVCRIGRAVAQHFKAIKVVVGYDARETSPEFAEAAARGICDAGADVLMIGMAGTEEMYCAVTEYNACAGIEITASHNPINYNGLKIVKSGSRPLDEFADFRQIKWLAETESWISVACRGHVFDLSEEARSKYVSRVLRFVSPAEFKPLKIVVNSGNGAAGPTFDAIAAALEKHISGPLNFIRVNHTPDMNFPNGIPNPLLRENQAATADIVKCEGADFGVAFDGDFDRCFFFDELGQFVPGEYVVGLLAEIFLNKEAGARIVHDARVIWNTRDIVIERGGTPVQSKTGHAFIKHTMRQTSAIYGGEMSSHHYFRDFAYCDSGMIPWLLIAELISRSDISLGTWLEGRYKKFPSSGEQNFVVEDPDKAIAAVRKEYVGAAHIDEMDGISFSFDSWRFNIRKSNTESLVRLNLEKRDPFVSLNEKLSQIEMLLRSFKVPA